MRSNDIIIGGGTSLPPMTAANELSHLIKHNGLKDIRAFFDRQFWSGKTITPSWTDLYTALQRKEYDTARLLVTWGAKPNSRDDRQEIITGFSDEERGDVLKVLKRAQCENLYEVSEQHKEHLRQTELRREAMKPFPAEWLRVLKYFQMGNKGKPHNEAVIAGGALRDTLNRKPVKDVDIFLPLLPYQATDQYIKSVFKLAGVDILRSEQRTSYGSSYTTEHVEFAGHDKNGDVFASPDHEGIETPVHYKNWVVKTVTDSANGKAGHVYNIIFTEMPRSYVDSRDFGAAVVDMFDIGLCQVFTDGNTVEKTDAYNKDAEKKTLTLIKNRNSTPDHRERLAAKYPDYKLSYPALNTAPQTNAVLDAFKQSSAQISGNAAASAPVSYDRRYDDVRDLPIDAATVYSQKMEDKNSGNKNTAMLSPFADSDSTDDKDFKTGTVKWFNDTQGIGFIEPDDGGVDIPIHSATVERAGLRTLQEGSRLGYKLGIVSGVNVAVEISPPRNAPVKKADIHRRSSPLKSPGMYRR